MEAETDSQALKRIFAKENESKTFARVFDRYTIAAVHSLAEKGFFEQLEFVISTGKEAHVFRAVDQSGNFRAVKIYKTNTGEFRNMQQYIDGDIRFSHIKNDKHWLVKAWSQKEYKNLELAAKAGVRVPLPIAIKDNVLVMEFIGTNGIATKPLKQKPAQDTEEFYRETLRQIAKLYQAKLVHADLSEYNILNQDELPVLIDIGQGVLTNHPKAKEFFERDIENIVHYFQTEGIETTTEDAKKQLRKLLSETKPQKRVLKKGRTTSKTTGKKNPKKPN